MTMIGDKNIKELIGKIVSTKMDKTIVVSVEVIRFDSIISKRFVEHRKYFAHDEDNLCHDGDIVKIRSHRPLSKRKKWMYIETIQEAPRA